MLNWRETAAARVAQEAIDAARQVGAVAVEAHALNTLAMAKCWMGDEAGALSAMDQSARLTERSGDDDAVGRLWVNRVELLFTLCRVEEAAAVARQGCAVLRDIGLGRSNGAYLAGYGSFPLVDLGCWDETRAAPRRRHRPRSIRLVACVAAAITRLVELADRRHRRGRT